MNRPDWWPEWVPQNCSTGHAMKPGSVAVKSQQCFCNDEDAYHEVWYCGTCYEEFFAPGHSDYSAPEGKRVF